MRRTLSPACASWTIAALAAVSLAIAQTYDAATRTVTVAPSGGDDTLALRTAFDVCQAVGPGCTVQRSGDREGSPVLLTFRDPRMRLRDMTVRNSAATATVGWRFGGRCVSALWGLLLLEGTSMRVDVERMAVEAAPGGFEGLSVLHAFRVSGIEEFPGGPIRPVTGDVSTRDSRIRGAYAGVLVSTVEGATVAIRGSESDGQEEAVWLAGLPPWS